MVARRHSIVWYTDGQSSTESVGQGSIPRGTRWLGEPNVFSCTIHKDWVTETAGGGGDGVTYVLAVAYSDVVGGGGRCVLTAQL